MREHGRRPRASIPIGEYSTTRGIILQDLRSRRQVALDASTCRRGLLRNFRNRKDRSRGARSLIEYKFDAKNFLHYNESESEKRRRSTHAATYGRRVCACRPYRSRELPHLRSGRGYALCRCGGRYGLLRRCREHRPRLRHGTRCGHRCCQGDREPPLRLSYAPLPAGRNVSVRLRARRGL